MAKTHIRNKLIQSILELCVVVKLLHNQEYNIPRPVNAMTWCYYGLEGV